MPFETRAASLGRVALCAAAAIALCACDANQYAPPPPPEVTVAQPTVQDVTLYLELTGTARAAAAADVRARVEGFLESIHFEPGSDVEKGDPLFVIFQRLGERSEGRD